MIGSGNWDRQARRERGLGRGDQRRQIGTGEGHGVASKNAGKVRIFAAMDGDRISLQTAPATMLPAAPRRTGESLGAWLLRLSETTEHRAVAESLVGLATSGSPPRRLQAIIYHLVRKLRPKTALEIGTLFAGTTHVIARALWANGEG